MDLETAEELKKMEGRDRLGQRKAGAKKRDVASMLSAGSSHTYSDMRKVGTKQATGAAACASGTANEDNPAHYSYFNKIKVRKGMAGSGNESACFEDLTSAITQHHPGFITSAIGAEVQGRKTKAAWVAALQKYLKQ